MKKILLMIFISLNLSASGFILGESEGISRKVNVIVTDWCIDKQVWREFKSENIIINYSQIIINRNTTQGTRTEVLSCTEYKKFKNSKEKKIN